MSVWYAALCLSRPCCRRWDSETRPEEDKLKAVKELPVPLNKTQVRAFLGIINFCQIMLQWYVTPLTDLTKKSAPNKVVWTEQCQQTWQKLKNLLC